MIVLVDVDYRVNETVAAAVVVSSWTASKAEHERVRTVAGAPAPYQPGMFYRRELPHLIDLLAELNALPECVIVDGYAWLGPQRPGLGARLYEELRVRCGAPVDVVGIAKRPFHDNAAAIAVTRGTSRSPLYVTAVGMEARRAATLVAEMHGAHRLPTLVQRVDHLARGRSAPRVD